MFVVVVLGEIDDGFVLLLLVGVVVVVVVVVVVPTIGSIVCGSGAVGRATGAATTGTKLVGVEYVDR